MLSQVQLCLAGLVFVTLLLAVLQRTTVLTWLRSVGVIPGVEIRSSVLSGVPPPAPLLNFDITKAKPRPYRPLRWAYHQTMALRMMEPDWWIELESTYCQRIAERKWLFARHGAKVLGCLPGSELACHETMEMVIDFLCARYPKQFKLDRENVFHNRILRNSFNINTIDPLIFILENVPEDFLITLPDEKTGLYSLRAGVSCSAVGWNLGTKIGLPLHEIHGPVAHYQEKLRLSMDRYFSKMPCHCPIQRGSWGLETGQPLFLEPDDPHMKIRETQDPNLKSNDIYLRVDWQTLRRLPRSRAVLFNFKALFTPLAEFRTEPYIPQLLAKVLREGNGPIMQYKGSWHVQHVALPLLEKWAEEQVTLGWVPKDWEERTLDEAPFFPGWYSKWQESQL